MANSRHISRRGMSVVEVLVALMLVSIGMLGIAGSTTLALRTTLDASRRRAALHDASRRITALQAAGCRGPASGSIVADARAERWTVGAPVNGFAAVSDSIDWLSAKGTRAIVLHSAITC